MRGNTTSHLQGTYRARRCRIHRCRVQFYSAMPAPMSRQFQPDERNGEGREFLMTWACTGADVRWRRREAARSAVAFSCTGDGESLSGCTKAMRTPLGVAGRSALERRIFGVTATRAQVGYIPTCGQARCFRDDRCRLPSDCARSHRAPGHSGPSGPPGRSRQRRARNGPRRAPPRCLRRFASSSARRMGSPRCA